MIVTLFLLLPVHSVFASSHGSLQERIEQTEPGETLILPAGKYDGNVVIDKPMKVIGNENVQIIVKNEENGINLHTDNISIENVEIIDTRTNPERRFSGRTNSRAGRPSEGGGSAGGGIVTPPKTA